jgi:hypothetical protein
MKYILLFLVFAHALPLSAQVKPSFFPEEVTPGSIEPVCYCKPGVRNKSKGKGIKINYTLNGGGKFKPEGEPLTEPYSTFGKIHQFELDIKAPIVRSESFKLAVGYEYYTEVYNFTRIGTDYEAAFRELDERHLKKNSLGIFMTKSFDEKHYAAFKASYSSHGDYAGIINFETRYSIYKAVAIFAIKPNEDFEWGIGLNVSESFRRTNIIPVVLLNKTFNDKWGFESILPAEINLRHNIDKDNLVLAGVEYESQSYRFGIPDGTNGDLDYAFNHSEIIHSVKLEHRWSDWIWSKFKTGYRMNFSTDFDSKAEGVPSFMVDPTNALFFEIGLFLSPPERVFK